ncbi:uncharacterized protein TNCV_479071 [Trichonephila clavipes]|nr:uncharacterized protein TNCV_479071 [Trichonephila clavipes]
MHMEKDNLFTIETSGCRISVENVKLSLPIQHNAFPKVNSRTTIMVSFFDVTGMKPCPNLSLNQLALRIACGIDKILSCKEDMIPLMRCPGFCALYITLNSAADGQLSKGCCV